MSTPELKTKRLRLTPLRVSDADDMVSVLSDDRLYEFTGDRSPSRAELETRYTAQVAGPTSGDESWHNWIVRLADSDPAIGFVQATVTGDRAELAWLVGVEWQGQGIATEAALAMSSWLLENGSRHLEAHVHPDHAASGRVAAAVGLAPTGVIDDDGEMIWDRRPSA
jgi:RimJ/RimL family protein N-acetyltransferase